MDTISVIIPAYNAESCIFDCLTSLQTQSLDRNSYEIILVDDGSVDKTVSIARSFGEKTISQANFGPATARNRGASEASGDILVFVDADCEFDYYFLQNLCLPLQQDFQIVGAQGRYLTKQTSIFARLAQYEIEERYNIYRKNKFIDMLGTYAVAYRRDVFFKNGMFDTSFPIASGEDFAFSSKLASKDYKMIFVPDAICYHRHPETLTAYFKQKYFRGYWRNLLYKKNSHILVRDNYTPQMLKLQVLLTLLLPVCCFFFVFFSIFTNYTIAAWLMLLVWLVVYLITIIPFMYTVIRFSKFLTIILPAFVFLRSLALATGLFSGYLRQIGK